MNRSTLFTQFAILSLFLLFISLSSLTKADDPCNALSDCKSCINSPTLTTCGWCGFTGLCQSAQDTCNATLWVNPVSRVLSVQNNSLEAYPSSQTVFLRPGVPLNLTIVVTPKPCKPIDLYLLMDFSASMDNDLANVQALAPQIANKVKALCTAPAGTCTNQYCARLGFGHYIEKPFFPNGVWKSNRWTRDYSYASAGAPSTHSFRARLPLSYDLNGFVSLVSTISGITGNIDPPENPIEGFLQAILCKELVRWPNYNTTYEPRRVILLLTDDTFHFRREGITGGIQEPFNYKCYIPDTVNSTTLDETTRNRYIDEASMKYDYPSFTQLRNAFVENNIIPIFGNSAGTFTTRSYADLAKGLGFGFSGVLNSNSDNIVPLIESAYNQIASELSMALQANGNEDLVRSVYPSTAYTNVLTNKTYTFNVTLLYNGVRPPADGLEIRFTLVGYTSISIFANLVNNCTCTGFCNNATGGVNNKCGAHGTCNCGACTCDEGWTGSLCTCNTDSSICPMSGGAVCSGGLHGYCECGKCICLEGYAGNACECPTTGCPSANALPCSGHGTCNCGVCTCQAAWNTTLVNDCSCPIDSNPANCKKAGDSQDCSGRGTCTICGTCDCPVGFSGTWCESTLIPCPADCSGHGNCTSGVCTCSTGWTGSDCSCSTVCPNNCTYPKGKCQCGTCVCEVGYNGTDCSCSTQCPVFGGLVCGGRGICGCDGVCQCNPGYTGADCSCDTTLVCPIGLNNVQCSGDSHGTCRCGTCYCKGGYTGANCSCEDKGCGLGCGESAGNGTCICGQCHCVGTLLPSSRCSCDANTHCSGYNSTTGLECSGHGYCSKTADKCDVCVCDPGYNGTDCSCSTKICDGPAPRGLTCSQSRGQGACICGQCVCNGNFTGAYCQCPPCETDCGPNGYCDCGTCKCNAFYKPPSCTWCDITKANNTCQRDNCVNYTSCSSCTDHNSLGCVWCADQSQCFNGTNAAELCRGSSLSVSNGDCGVIGALNEGQAIGVFTGVFGAVILGLIGAIAAYKFINMMRDKREWSKFEKEKEKSRWKGDDNPLFKSSTTEFNNPLYNAQ